MSKGSLLLWSLVQVQVCIVQLCVISSWQLTAGQAAGGEFLCRQDPIGRPPRLMSKHGREELHGHSSDWIFDEELADEGYTSDGGGVPVVEEEEGWLPDDDGGGGAKGSSSGSGGGGGGDVECPECGKFFKNDKSMFGHLRSHPNRGYKGATPPVNKLKLSPEPETAAASPSSPSPSGGTHQPCARRDRPLTPFELVCTYALLTLPYPENSQPTQQVPPPPPVQPPSFCQSETNVGVVEQGVGTSDMAAAEAHADQYGGSIVKIPKKRRNMLKEIREAHRKKAKQTKLVPPPPPKEKGPYICKHCYAEFSTHQALGGHMAGHHRDKKVQTLNDASSSRAHQGMAGQSQDWKLQVKGGGDDDDGWGDSGLSLQRGLLSEQLSMASNVPRQSGQAWGGQMIEMRRQHSGRRSGGLTLAAPAPAPTPTQADDRGGRRLWNIDLNAEATEQE
ncbi:hypothetical protein BDA96_06G130700 [Sorghum bicolor]|uniref:C2H2-type domain-containing protein n=1 Tax=Sorghum bicolor TaxID=4558 RepID=A0A921QR09_SORBI|nr:hypothetical protein BDA96_06G130700 [Sorghum bicolor]